MPETSSKGANEWGNHPWGVDLERGVGKRGKKQTQNGELKKNTSPGPINRVGIFECRVHPGRLALNSQGVLWSL